MTQQHPRTTVVAARLPDGRFLIADFDPATPDSHSPLRRQLRTEPTPAPTPRSRRETQQATPTATPTNPES